MATSTDWREIPDIALISIYSSLSDQNKLNVACTCKNWYRLFSTPKLWRYRRVVFDSQNAETSAEKEVKFVEKFGHCLYKFCLNFGQPSFKTCMSISKAADMFLTRVSGRNDIHIKELEIEAMHMEQYWHFILSRNRLVTALCRMIRRQRFLQTVYLAGARMRVIDGCRLLEALVKGATGSTIQTIYMEDFFETRVFPFRNPRYMKVMSRFLSLKHVHINYRYLNGTVLRNLANKLSRSLENISIILDGDVRAEIDSGVWREFSEKCPMADIGVYLCTTIVRGNDLRIPFVDGMPISNIYLTSWSRIDETEMRLAVLLRHLARLYSNTLETFAMFFEHHEPVDSDVLYLLTHCRHITDLCIQARLSADTVIDIMKLQQQNRLALKSVNLTIPNLTDADWQRIDVERERLLTNVTDFVYVGPNDFESSSSGSSTERAFDDDDDDDNEGGDLPDMVLHGEQVEIHVSDDEDRVLGGDLDDFNNNDDDDFLI